MAKKKNQIWIILIIIGIFLFKGGDFLGATAPVGTAIISRDLPETVDPGQSFIVTYTASGMGSGSWGVLIEDTISGGCSPTEIHTGWLSPQTYYSTTISTPSGGTCFFSGNYQFAGSTEKTITGGSSVLVLSCPTLKSDAITKIGLWVDSPISSRKTDALNAIILWASQC